MKNILVKLLSLITCVMIVLFYFSDNVSAKQYLSIPSEDDSAYAILANDGNTAADAETKINSAESDEACISAKTQINVSLKNTITSKTAHKDDVIVFVTTKDVILDQVPVIPAGTTVLGKIVKAKSAGLLGQDGELIFSIDSVTTINNITVPLSYTATYVSSNKHSVLTDILKKGKDVSCDAGTNYVATVKQDVDLGVSKENLPIEIAVRYNKK